MKKLIGKKYKKIRSNVIQTMNIKEINSYLKNISENLSDLIKKDKEAIMKENDYGEYENIYDYVNDEKNNNDKILFLALITFHHKKGSVVECTFPNKESIVNSDKLDCLVDEKNEKLNTKALVLDHVLNNLVNYCLIDGLHLVNSDSQIFFIHDLKKVLYCFSYYIQKKTDNEENKIEDDFQEDIRGCIQKSICIVSTLPIFGNLNTFENYYIHLSTQMNLYMNQKSLNDKTPLIDIYTKLEKEFYKEKKWLLNLRKAFCILKDDILVILKLIILEKRIVVFSQIPSNVSLLIMTLLTIFQGNSIYERTNYDKQNGTPLKIFHEKYLIYPLFTLYDMDILLNKINEDNEINFLIGVTNNIIMNNKKLNYSCLINIDEQKVTYSENLNESLKVVNGRERKFLLKIYKLINNKISDKMSISEEGNANNGNLNETVMTTSPCPNESICTNLNKTTSISKINSISKKLKNDEPWIIANDKGKDISTFYLIKKYIIFYYQNILFDVSYLMHEMKIKYEDDPFQKMILIHKNINEKYNILIPKEENEKDNNTKSDNNASKDEILPYFEEVLVNPFYYILYSVLPIYFDSKFANHYKKKTGLEKKRESILIKLNNLAFLSEWCKTRNFRKWVCSYKYQIIYYSTLNTSKANVTLYDYDDNLYSGSMLLGKKNGAGQYNYREEKLIYSGEYKDDLREGKGKLTSIDESYYYFGDWVKNKMEGEGFLYSSYLGKYTGQFQNDHFEGKGNLVDLANNIYEGMFHKGMKKGKGELKYNNGNVYTGEFRYDKCNGKGVLKDAQGNIIEEGTFKAGVLIKAKKSVNSKDERVTRENLSIPEMESIRIINVNPLKENEEMKMNDIQQNDSGDDDDDDDKVEEKDNDEKNNEDVNNEEINEKGDEGQQISEKEEANQNNKEKENKNIINGEKEKHNKGEIKKEVGKK